ncbi:MAG: hypothetical protein ABIQ55_00625 [Gemmatimonadaceae bacterium]
MPLSKDLRQTGSAAGIIDLFQLLVLSPTMLRGLQCDGINGDAAHPFPLPTLVVHCIEVEEDEAVNRGFPQLFF